jgi:hypothetical protein
MGDYRYITVEFVAGPLDGFASAMWTDQTMFLPERWRIEGELSGDGVYGLDVVVGDRGDVRARRYRYTWSEAES